MGRGVGQASSRGFSRSTFPKITQTFLGEILPHKCSKTLISCKNRKAKIVAKTPDIQRISGVLVGEGGFEPPKSLTADLQSVPFGHSGIPPYSLCCTHFETQRSGFNMKRRKAIADMELFASAESGMEQASFDGGAGRRIRTPDLLITKMRLYVYCVHFVPILPDTSNLRISFRAINPYSIRALFARWRQGWRQTDFQLVEKSACRGHHVFLAC